MLCHRSGSLSQKPTGAESLVHRREATDKNGKGGTKGDDDQAWRSNKRKALDKLGLPSDYSGWTDRKGFKGHGLPTSKSDRHKAVLDVGWGKRCLATPNEHDAARKRGWIADISQTVSADRMPFGRLATLTQNFFEVQLRV